MTTDSWIQIVNGKAFDFENPSAFEWKADEIAHHLAGIPRFNGATVLPWYGSDHSILVSDNCSPEAAPWGLWHDGHEMITGDISSPIIKHFMNAYFNIFTYDCDVNIQHKFNIKVTPDILHEVVYIDAACLIAERNAFIHPSPMPWSVDAFADKLPPIENTTALQNGVGYHTHANRMERFLKKWKYLQSLAE